MSTPERILFALYVLVGPCAWLLVAYFVKIGRERMNKLVRNRDTLPPVRPKVTAIVPAKDEGSGIRQCIDGVLDQDYGAFELIAVNDRSTDDTGAILDGMTYVHPHTPARPAAPGDLDLDFIPADLRGSRFRRVLHIGSLPPGWLGKCHALDQAARHATGEWLFFVDSDVRLRPNALSKLAAVAIARQYDAISILTRIETHTFVERLMLPLLAGTWMTLFQGDQTNEDSETEKALANGQVFLIRAEAYFAAGGHAAVKDRIVEDVELMRLLKSQGRKTRFLTGPHLAATRMHTSLNQMFNGWARIFAGTARGSIWPMVRMIVFLLVSVLAVLPASVLASRTGYATTMYVTTTTQCYGVPVWLNTFWQQGIYWASAVLAHVLLMTIVLGFVWRWSGNAARYALLWPLSVPIEIAILAYAVRKAVSGKIDWRGSSVDVRDTSRVKAAG